MFLFLCLFLFFQGGGGIWMDFARNLHFTKQ